ncbi:MAG TPA: hypothetical protein QGI71_07770 [Dehalococcoidia bacterium]|nr:hypothetical protein [Dehalococcoidia bacterium]
MRHHDETGRRGRCQQRRYLLAVFGPQGERRRDAVDREGVGGAFASGRERVEQVAAGWGGD